MCPGRQWSEDGRRSPPPPAGRPPGRRCKQMCQSQSTVTNVCVCVCVCVCVHACTCVHEGSVCQRYGYQHVHFLSRKMVWMMCSSFPSILQACCMIPINAGHPCFLESLLCLPTNYLHFSQNHAPLPLNLPLTQGGVLDDVRQDIHSLRGEA